MDTISNLAIETCNYWSIKNNNLSQCLLFGLNNNNYFYYCMQLYFAGQTIVYSNIYIKVHLKTS